MHQSRPQTLVILLICLIMFSIPKTLVAEQPQKIIFLHYWTDALRGGIEEMVAAFNQLNPKYNLKSTGFEHETFKISIGVMLKAGNPPDLFSYWSGARMQAFVDADYLAPIDDIWTKAGLDKKFSRPLAMASTYNGHKYSLPVTQHYVCFFYNKKLFEKYAIQPPADWTSFLAACDKLKSSDMVPIALGARDHWPAQFWFDYLLLRTAGSAMRDRLLSGKAAYTDPHIRTVFKFWEYLLQKKYFNASPNLYD